MIIREHPSLLLLDAICRPIEISVCEALERPAPESLVAVNHVLPKFASVASKNLRRWPE